MNRCSSRSERHRMERFCGYNLTYHSAEIASGIMKRYHPFARLRSTNSCKTHLLDVRKLITIKVSHCISGESSQDIRNEISILNVTSSLCLSHLHQYRIRALPMVHQHKTAVTTPTSSGRANKWNKIMTKVKLTESVSSYPMLTRPRWIQRSGAPHQVMRFR